MTAAGFYRPRTAFWLAFLAPLVVLVAAWLLSPSMTKDASTVPALRDGALYGTIAGALTACLLGLWTLQSCKGRNSAFLAPVALGFFVKLLGLCLGTWLCFRQIGQGSHFTYAFCFLAASFGWQVIFTPSLVQMRGRILGQAQGQAPQEQRPGAASRTAQGATQSVAHGDSTGDSTGASSSDSAADSHGEARGDSSGDTEKSPAATR